MRSFTGRDILSLKDFERDEFVRVFQVCDELAPFARDRRNTDLLKHKTLLTAFYQPSTRTRTGHRGRDAPPRRARPRVLRREDDTRAGDFYQESIKDTIHMLEYYADVIAMRHFQQGAPAEAAKWASVPVINCGDGWGEHPTQVLTDLYTIGNELGTLDGLTYPARRRHAHADDALDPLRAVAVRREGVRRRAARHVAAARVQGRARRAQRRLRGGGVDRGRHRRLRRDLHGAGRAGRLHEVARRARAAAARSRPRRRRIRSRASCCARRRRRSRSSSTACPAWTSCPPTSTRRGTRGTGWRRSTASSCGWRCWRSCSERRSNAVKFTLNGRELDVVVGEGESLLDLLRDRAGAPLDEGRLRAGGLLRRVHRARRRAGGRVVRPEGEPRARASTSSPRKGCSDGDAAAVGRLLRRSRARPSAGSARPGIVMKAEALLRRRRRSRRARSRARAARQPLPLHRLREDRRRGRARGRRAPRRAAARSRTERTASARAAIRYRARELALGDKPLRGDMIGPGMLHGALRFSDHPRARVAPHRHLEGRRRTRASSRSSPPPTSRASARSGSITQDWRQLVAEGETTAYVGDVLAAVAAETRRGRARGGRARRGRVRGARRRSPTRSRRSSRARRRCTRAATCSRPRSSAAATSTRRSPAPPTSSADTLPHAVHRARVPRAGGGARRPGRRRRRSTSTPRARASGTTGGRSRRSSALPEDAGARHPGRRPAAASAARRT